MQINTNLALLVFSKEYTTIIGTIYGGTITRDDALEGLTYTEAVSVREGIEGRDSDSDWKKPC